jgi:hypothetical protein
MSEENDFQSNRFTSSYHPPFQRLLPEMSPDAYCKLYFLVYGDSSVQSIPTRANWDIDDLKTAIMNKAHLGHLKTSDIILRRVRIAFFWPA